MGLVLGYFWTLVLLVPLACGLEYIVVRRQRRAATSQRNHWTTKYIAALFVICFVMLVLVNLDEPNNQHFSALADSFLHGRLDLDPTTELNDAALVNGRYYWALGPFPAVVLMPFVLVGNLIGQLVYQGYVQPFLVLAVFALVFRVARHFGYRREDALVWGFAFVFGSVFIDVGLFAWSWHFGQVVAVLLLWWVLYEYTHQKRYWLIGVLLGCLLTTRLTAALAILFFVMEILFLSGLARGAKARALVMLLVPFAVGVAALGAYNFARFGSLTESGYTMQDALEPLQKTRAYGLFGLVHLPGNLYYFLLATPVPVFVDDGSFVLKFPYVAADPMGMSVFITSPVVVYLFLLKQRDRLTRLLLLTIAVTLVPILLYYGIGYYQMGYRYALDFLPLVYFVLMRQYMLERGNLSGRFRLLVCVSALVNFFLFFTIFLP